jgi:hypothetical protein
MAFDFDVKDLSFFLYFRSPLLTVKQIGTEGIHFVVQRDKLIHEIVFHFALVSRCHVVRPHDCWMHHVDDPAKGNDVGHMYGLRFRDSMKSSRLTCTVNNRKQFHSISDLSLSPSRTETSGRWLEYNDHEEQRGGLLTHSWNPTVFLAFVAG